MTLEKTWLRIIVSLFLGGAISEGIHISTGDPNRPQESNFAVLYAIVLYIILTVYVKWKLKKKKLFGKVKYKSS